MNLISCVVLIWSLLVVGCASYRTADLNDLPLPASSTGNCCWQALQALEIQLKDQSQTLSGAFAHSREGISLVLLDAMGRRLLSAKLDSHHNLNTYRAPELPAKASPRFLLASSMLAWWPYSDWQAALIDTPNWRVTEDDEGRLLSYRGRALLRVTYSSNAQSLVRGIGEWTIKKGETVQLSHLRQPLSVTVVTVDWSKI